VTADSKWRWRVIFSLLDETPRFGRQAFMRMFGLAGWGGSFAWAAHRLEWAKELASPGASWLPRRLEWGLVNTGAPEA